MTEKRFYTEGRYVMQDGEVYVTCNGEHNADVVATALNELLDKNEELKELRDYFERKKYEYHNKWNLAHLDNINLRKENEYLKKKILEEIDLEVAYVNETYSDGRMSKEQHNGAIISLRQLREKFE